MNDSLQRYVSGNTRIVQTQTEDGDPLALIYTAELSPEHAKSQDESSIGGILVFLMLVCWGGLCGNNPSTAWIIVTGLASALVFMPVIWYLDFKIHYYLIASISAQEICCAGRRFPFKQNHSFICIEHPEANTEKRDHQHEIEQTRLKQRKIIQKKPYFQDSLLVCLNILGQTHTVTSVYLPHNAADVRSALELADRWVASTLQMHSDSDFEEKDHWGDGPGGLGD